LRRSSSWFATRAWATSSRIALCLWNFIVFPAKQNAARVGGRICINIQIKCISMQAGVSHRRQAESANYYPRSSTPKFEADLVGIQRRRSPRDLSAILALRLSLSLTNPNSTAGQLWSLRYKWNDAPRVVKWSTMIGCVLVLFGKDGWNWAWLNSCCFSPCYSQNETHDDPAQASHQPVAETTLFVRRKVRSK